MTTSIISRSDTVLQDSPFFQIPIDMTIQVFTRLSGQDIGVSALVCRQWNRILQGDQIWCLLLDKDFPSVDPSTFASSQDAYQTLYSNLTKGVYALDTVQHKGWWIRSFASADRHLFLGISSVLGVSDNAIKVCNISTKEQITTFQGGHSKPVTSLAFAGEKLFSGSEDKIIKVWEKGECTATLQGHGGGVASLAVAGEILFSGSFDRTIKVWKKGECTATLQGHGACVSSLVFTGEKLFSGSFDKTIMVWDPEIGQPIATLQGHKSCVFALAHTGEKLFSGSADKTIKVWNTRTNQCTATLQGHEKGVYSLAVIAGKNGKLFSGSDDCTIRVWDIITEKCIATLQGHNSCVYSLVFANGKLFSGSSDCTMKTWDFTARHGTVFQEIIQLLETGDGDPKATATQQALERFSRMPKTAKNAIYKKLHEIRKPFDNDYDRNCAEDAFYNRNGQSSTPAEKAQAIRGYLNRPLA
jgi:WD40 repeat protein